MSLDTMYSWGLPARPTLPRTTKAPSPLPSSFPNQVIFQSPNSLFLENIAVRVTSELLLTSVASPTLFALDPNTTNGTLASFHTLLNASSLTSITEYQPVLRRRRLDDQHHNAPRGSGHLRHLKCLR
ncbi:hypothetical protein B0H19DRAFT_1256131 [Mycena capillaripes]|nr:hypothetical protein B0H19DRAFT_1256131 [Mycena capillaripes]